MDTVTRDIIAQTFFSQGVAVGTTPTPLAPQLSLPSMIQSFILCNFSSNANSVFFGDQNVSTTTGIELITGTSVTLLIVQDRQFYEIQDPVLISLQAQLCKKVAPVSIPVIVWDPSNFFLIASVATNISALLFRNVYV